MLPPFVYYRTDLIKEQRILYEFYGKMGIMTDREKLLPRKTFYFACGSFFATNTDDFIHPITNTERKILHENMERI